MVVLILIYNIRILDGIDGCGMRNRSLIFLLQKRIREKNLMFVKSGERDGQESNFWVTFSMTDLCEKFWCTFSHLTKEELQLSDRDFVDSGVIGIFLPCRSKKCVQLNPSECNWWKVTRRYNSVIYWFLLAMQERHYVVDRRVDGLQRRQVMLGGKCNFADGSSFLNKNGWSTDVSNTRHTQ